MYLDFKYIVQDALSINSVVSVEPCPHPELGEITSTICFSLATERIRPEQVAVEVQERLRQRKVDEWFDVSVGGQGHLNATPTNKYRETFVSRVCQEPALLLSAKPLVISFVDNFSVEEEFGELKLNGDYLCAEAEKTSNQDAKQLAAMIHGKGGSVDDFLMFALCLEDKEVDASFYINKLAGRQNFPWYMKKFKEDSGNFIKALAKNLPPDTQVQRVLPTELLPSLNMLLNCRQERSLTKFIKFQYEIIQQFYRFYNLPGTRLVPQSTAKDLASSYYHLVLTMRFLVEEGLGRVVASDLD